MKLVTSELQRKIWCHKFGAEISDARQREYEDIKRIPRVTKLQATFT